MILAASGLNFFHGDGPAIEETHSLQVQLHCFSFAESDIREAEEKPQIFFECNNVLGEGRTAEQGRHQFFKFFFSYWHNPFLTVFTQKFLKFTESLADNVTDGLFIYVFIVTEHRFIFFCNF